MDTFLQYRAFLMTQIGQAMEHPNLFIPAPFLQLPPAHIDKGKVPLSYPNKS